MGSLLALLLSVTVNATPEFAHAVPVIFLFSSFIYNTRARPALYFCDIYAVIFKSLVVMSSVSEENE